MNARVFKAGNSLAIRIPSVIAKHMEIEDGTSVDLTVDECTLSVRKANSVDLAALIARITPDNIHGPQFEELAGRERW